ncbi:MAG: hypothetical protein H6551_08230 [Chitinophagales bacterium]|nr:hypothetical protein [Chitinophagaceae bacterium]MCB9065110.1 hypothetical protein [Chitinophagales bacterium]
MKKWQKLLLLVIILIAIAGFIGYKMWTKPHTKVEDVKAVEMTVTALSTEFDNDEQAANNKYSNDKIAILVTGTVSSTETNQDGKLVIILTGDGAPSDVQCTMRDNGQSASEGANISVKGFCTGTNLFGVLLTDCVITNN